YRRMMVADSLFKSQASELINSGMKLSPANSPGYSGESFSITVTGDEKGIVFSGDYQEWSSDDSNILRIMPETPVDNSGTNIDVNSQRGFIVAEEDFQTWVLKKSEELRQMGDKMLSEIYEWEVGTETNLSELYNTLKTELSNSGIDTPFEFAIIEDNRVVDGIMPGASEAEFLTSNYSVRLFSDRLIRKNTRLSVVFPKKANFILGSMSLILGASMLFSLIILLTFALSIFLILRQKRVSEMKSDFINNMTHEFKTPIATISLAADTISNPRVIGDQERIKHFVSMIKKENTRMNKQVETILQISSLDKKEMEFIFGEVDIHEIIGRAIETIGIQVEERGGNIYFYPEAKNPVVRGDSEHLTNLFHNLLDNANKYSESNPEITIRTESADGYIMITVEDRGIGMTKSVQSRVFERFYRQSSGNVHNVKGFGLGLNYVRAIVEAHEGRIELFSEPGKGTRFEVYLPQTDTSR
ncbi:MAG: HAMP domain-containing sensor histidine kinase, partial [Bacteroidales bacterium]